MKRIIKLQKLTPSNLIQICVVVGIFVTCILMCQQIRKQGEFNRNSLRPWVSSEPSSIVEVADGYIRVSYSLKNDGKTPAYKVFSYSTLTQEKPFPVDRFKQKIKKAKESK